MCESNRDRRFVIPAAGCASRFGGISKELLPITATDCGLTNAIRFSLALTGRPPVVISNPEKYAAHAAAIERAEVRAEIIVKIDGPAGEMWSAIRLGLDAMSSGGLLMPDTVIAVAHEAVQARASITFGCFMTATPYRFSCMDIGALDPPRIQTKSMELKHGLAWGCVLWDKKASRGLIESGQTHFDRALEEQMKRLGFGMFMLDGYADLGTFDQYASYLSHSQIKPNRSPALPSFNTPLSQHSE